MLLHDDDNDVDDTTMSIYKKNNIIWRDMHVNT